MSHGSNLQSQLEALRAWGAQLGELYQDIERVPEDEETFLGLIVREAARKYFGRQVFALQQARRQLECSTTEQPRGARN